MEKTDAHIVVADLLRLRRWAVEALCTGRPDSRRVDAVPSEIWFRFLALERCAGPLLEKVRAADIPERAQKVIRSVAATESQSALTARAEGRQIAKITGDAGYPVVVLKGGVNALTGKTPLLPLVDIDLLVDRSKVKDMVERLEKAGFGRPARELEHHQGLKPAVDRLAVEVHWTTHDDGRPLDPLLWNRVRPIPEAPPLKRLSTHDHLEHLIEHAIVVHRERAVSLRDVVITGLAARDCTDGELTQVRERLAKHELQGEMISLLDFAIAAADGRSMKDPFIESCATFYSAVVLAPFLPKAFSSSGAIAFILEIELGRISRADAMKNALKWRGTGQKHLNAIAERFPVIGKGLFGPSHVAYYTTVAAAVLPSIRSTRAQALEAVGQ
ncbi:MAG TPA: nucleotidyltransferase family protein [Gemmatimonadaceae bacterium]